MSWLQSSAFKSFASSFVAIYNKEFLHVIRDKSTLFVALSIPIFQLILFGFIDTNVRDLPTTIVDQDRSSESRLFVSRLEATRTFRVVHMTDRATAAREEVVSGRSRVGVVIPPDFRNKRSRGGEAQVLVLIDGSDSTASGQALASINGLAASVTFEDVQKRVEPLEVKPTLSVRPLILFNPDGRTANYIFPGLIAIMLQIVATVLTALAIVRERERGTLEQLLVTPIHPLGLMLGKLAPYLLLGLAETTLILLVMRFGFAVPVRGNLLFLFAMAVIYLFALLATGLFISTRAQSQSEAQQLAQMILLPSIFLSGYIFPAAGLPWPLYAIGRLLPATHMVEILRGIVLRDAGPLDLWKNVAALLAISVVLVAQSVRRFQKVAL